MKEIKQSSDGGYLVPFSGWDVIQKLVKDEINKGNTVQLEMNGFGYVHVRIYESHIEDVINKIRG